MKLSLVLFSAAVVIMSLSQLAGATVTKATVTFNQDIVTNTYYSPAGGRFYSFNVENLLAAKGDDRVPGDHEAKCYLTILTETDGGLIQKGSTLTYDSSTSTGGVDQHDWTWIPSYGGFFEGGWYATSVGFSGRMILYGRYGEGPAKEQDVSFSANCSIHPGEWAIYGTQFWLPSRASLIRKLQPYLTYTEIRN